MKARLLASLMPFPLRSGRRRTVVWHRHRTMQPADAVVASYPRSGSTWLAMMLAEYLSGRRLDQTTLNEVVPMVGRQRTDEALLPDSGRLLRTHEPYRPEYRRAVYIVRDPRDVVISYYNFQRRFLETFGGTLERFVRRFVAGRADGYGAWHRHVESWLDAPPTAVVVVRYEDFRRETEEVLRRRRDASRRRGRRQLSAHSARAGVPAPASPRPTQGH